MSVKRKLAFLAVYRRGLEDNLAFVLILHLGKKNGSLLKSGNRLNTSRTQCKIVSRENYILSLSRERKRTAKTKST